LIEQVQGDDIVQKIGSDCDCCSLRRRAAKLMCILFGNVKRKEHLRDSELYRGRNENESSRRSVWWLRGLDWSGSGGGGSRL